MKDKNLITWIVVVISLVITALCAGYSLREKEIKPPSYSNADSIRNASIDSVKGEYQQVIDSLQKTKVVIRWRTKEYKKIADSLSINADSVCAPVIAAKDNEIKSLYEDVKNSDIEAQLYSAMLDSAEIQRMLGIKRFAALSYKTDSIILNYKDSLASQRKQSVKAIKKEKGKTFFYKVTTTVACVLGIYSIVK